MASRKTPAAHKGAPKREGGEWIGGVATMPAFVTGEGEPFKPMALLWLDGDGMILGSAMARPAEWKRMAGKSLREAIEKPMVGIPHAPARVKVANEELADALREAHPGIEVVVAPTPEFDAFIASMFERLQAEATPVNSYLSGEVTPDAVASLFRAAAALFKTRPWNIVPSDQHVFFVNLEALGLHEAVVSIIGQGGENFGLILFSNMRDFKKYLRASEAIDRGKTPKFPPLFSLNFERGADLDPALRKEIAKHGWEVAAANAYPLLLVTDAEMMNQPLTPKDLAKAEALALAFTHAMGKKESLRAVWDGGEPVILTIPVETSQGAFDVIIGAPRVFE